MVDIRLATASDVERINEILNHPDVRPHVFHGDSPLDFSQNIGVTPAYLTEHGVLFAEAVAPGEYLVASGFTPEGRGLHAVHAHKKALDHFFSTTDAVRVSALFTPENSPAIRNLHALGFHYKAEFGESGCVEIDWIQWALGSSDCERLGKAWCESFGVPWWTRDHARMLGAFVKTVRGGWSGKAMAQFNKWAKLSVNDSIHPLNEQGTLFRHNDVTFGVPEDCAAPAEVQPAAVEDASSGLATLDGGFFSRLPGEGFREKVLALEEIMLGMPQSETFLRHHFAPGIYMRELLIPKGSLIIGKIHAHEHPVMLASGEAVYMTEFDGLQRIVGPRAMVSSPGVKRLLLTITDCVWYTVHSNPEDTKDLATLEDWIIAPSYAALSATESKALGG
jgi:hypothetical protein